jgi:putative endopeptidase
MFRLLLPVLALLVLAAPVRAQHALGIDTTAIDRDVRPQDDFYRWVNGLWLDRTEIPADRSNFGSFTELRDASTERVRDIITYVVAGGYADDSDAARIAAAYTAYMDTVRIEQLGVEPLAPDFARIEAVSASGDLPVYFAESRRDFGTAPFSTSVAQDRRNAEQYAAYAGQAGLGLPDRSYYLEDRFADIRAAYVEYLATLFDLAGLDGANADAQRVLDLETRLAEAQWSRVENRDREATYNKMSVADLDAAYPNLAWPAMLSISGLEVDSVIVAQPSYLAAVNDLVVEVPVADWQAWMRARLIDGASSLLASAFRDARFDFRGRTLVGQEEQQPRWRQAVGFTEGTVGEAVGRLYVQRHFPAEASARMDEMIENLRAAFRESIIELDWMTDATKAEALDKLASFNTKIGYPGQWRDYSALDLRPDDLLGNARRAGEWRYDEMVDRIGSPVDRDRWGMTPQTVNAYYSATLNEIVFPAAILQPPFFDVEADDAVNYGAIGGVIGHEFSHGFDDQGRRSDGTGNLRDWWTEEDAEEYLRRANLVIEQYNQFEPLPGQNIIGAQTIGENIADLAGLTMAYRAYRMSLNGEEPPVIDGFTGDQRFFMGWAQIWRVLWREPLLRQQLQTGSHSPGEFRTNGIVPHLDAFQEAFDVQPGDGMYRSPEDRIRIW